MANIITYDFQTILTKLRNKLSIKETWIDTYQSSTGTMLMDLIAAGNENLGYYLERMVQELFIGTAKTDSSIRHLAALLGYSPARKTSAVGTNGEGV